MSLRHHITEARTSVDGYKSRIHDLLSGYQTGMNKARAEADKYREPEQYLMERRGELAPAAAAMIEDADRRLMETVSGALHRLHDAVIEDAGRRPDRAFMDTLADVKRFNLKLSKSELAALAKRSTGAYIELQALASVARDSGFKITNLKSVSDLEATISEIERKMQAPIQYADSSDLSAALAVYGRAVQRDQVTGKALFETHDVTPAGLAVSRGGFNSISKLLDELDNTWGDRAVPGVDAFQDLINPETRDVITAEDQHAEELDKLADGLTINTTEAEGHKLAEEIGAREAKMGEETKRILGYYTAAGRRE